MNQLAMYYPERAGAKERGGTSQDAADAIEASGRAAKLRERVLAAFEKCHRFTPWAGATADEIAYQICEPILSIRPRVSELRKQGKITPTGERRKSSGGAPSNVWRLA